MKKLFKYVFVLICFCLPLISLFLLANISYKTAKAEITSSGIIYEVNDEEQGTITITCKVDENTTITLIKNKSEIFSLPNAEEYLAEDKFLAGWKDETGGIFSTKQLLVLGADKSFTAIIENKCKVIISSNKKETYYVIPGEKFTLPEYKDEYNKSGYVVRGYKINGKTYKAGQEITVYKDTTINVKYCLTGKNIALICSLSAVVVAGTVSAILVARKRKIKKAQSVETK